MNIVFDEKLYSIQRNLIIENENISAANTKIRDVDVAKEFMRLIKKQILGLI